MSRMKVLLRTLKANALTLGVKVSLGLTVLLLPAVFGVVILVNRLFITDATSTLYKINSDAASNLSAQLRELLSRMMDRSRVGGSLLMKEAPVARAVVAELFEKESGFIGLVVTETADAKVPPRLIKWEFAAELRGLDGGKGNAEGLFRVSADSLRLAHLGEVRLEMIAADRIAIFSPLVLDKGVATHVVGGVFNADRFGQFLMLNEQVASYLVDGEGRLVAHSDPSRTKSRESLAHLPVVRSFLDGKVNNGQMRYLGVPSGIPLLAAFRAVGVGGLGVVSEIPEERAFELANTVTRRSVLLGVVILGIAFMFGAFFSGSLTRPIRELSLAAQAVADGDFSVKVTPRSGDELGKLAGVFNEMTLGLAERDRVKEVFSKFHNKEIADKLLSGEVKLGGEKYEAVVFFSDIRGFTALSETMSPQELVEMLNEYMTCMVHVIREHQGVVDKFVGDAIMAIWGVPFSTEWDAVLAVRACLAMRQELARLNERRIARGQVPLKIGMGLNMGPLVAGNIGSEEKMEFTVIGDTVNTASRLESMTKAYGTDLLISEMIYQQVKDEFYFDACEAGKVKGKSEALQVYKVKGYPDPRTKEPIIIETPYSSYAAEKSDKVESTPKAA